MIEHIKKIAYISLGVEKPCLVKNINMITQILPIKDKK